MANEAERSAHGGAGTDCPSNERNENTRVNRTTVEPEPFVGIREAASFLGKPSSWLYNRAERLGIPRYRVGQQLRFRLSELAEWVTETGKLGGER